MSTNDYAGPTGKKDPWKVGGEGGRREARRRELLLKQWVCSRGRHLGAKGGTYPRGSGWASGGRKKRRKRQKSKKTKIIRLGALWDKGKTKSTSSPVRGRGRPRAKKPEKET